MRKQRIQPSFASLTEAEFTQLTGWVERETYAVVLDRVRKPRSEGGYGLNISRGPLERLYKKKSTLDDINRRLNAGHKLSLADVEAIKACDQAAPEDVHDALMSHAYDRASSGDNTPAQLLDLQRLADFPARAELREEKAAIARSREERAQRKDQRAQAAAELAKEMHTHKIALSLRKEDRAQQAHTHKLKSDQFRQQLALARLNSNLNLSNADAITPTNALVGPVRPGGPRSRDAITNHNAAPADPYPNSEQPRDLSTPVREAHELVSVPACAQLSTERETMDEDNRHAALLLAGKLKTHYKHDPNSPLATFYALTAPEVLVEAQRLSTLSDAEIQAYIAQHNIDITPCGDPDYNPQSKTSQTSQTSQPTENLSLNTNH